LDRWMYVCMYVWMYGWMDGWIRKVGWEGRVALGRWNGTNTSIRVRIAAVLKLLIGRSLRDLVHNDTSRDDILENKHVPFTPKLALLLN